MFASLVEIVLGLWWVAVTASTAALLALRAAWVGVIPRLIGMLGACALAMIGVSYWLDVFDAVPDETTVDMRRGAAIILWPAIGYSVGWLLRISRKVAAQ